VRLRLAEAEARIDDDALPANPASSQACARALQECLDLLHDVDVVRGLLHGARFALHVHEAHGAAALECGLERASGSAGAHIIDEARAGTQRRRA
jgi:hypothetical protein